MIIIAPANPDDTVAMAALLDQMDRFYGATSAEPPAIRLQQINEALFTTPPAAHALLAWDGTNLAGIVAYSFLWPAAGLTRSLYLKELYVADAYRRRGVGKLLMEALTEVAAKHRCSRVEWTTDTDNPAAQAFYDTLGHQRHPSKIFYRLEDTGTGLRLPQ
jgi:GNAT superfamily N-acetyltransferase